MDEGVARLIQAITEIGGLIGVFLLVMQLAQTRHATRVQHTANFLLDDRRRKYIQELSEALGGSVDLHTRRTPVTEQIVHDICKDGAVRAKLREMLNYYDTLCLFVEKGVVDRHMIKDSLVTVIRVVWVVWEPYVERTRKEMGSTTIYEHLERVVSSWDKSLPPERRMLEKAPKPQ